VGVGISSFTIKQIPENHSPLFGCRKEHMQKLEQNGRNVSKRYLVMVFPGHSLAKIITIGQGIQQRVPGQGIFNLQKIITK
jgi:hypothetical protein